MDKNSMKISREKRLFNLLLILLWVAILVLGYARLNIYFVDKDIKQQKEELELKEKELAESENIDSYNKFLLVKDLEDNYTKMPWFEHIPKIIAIFDELKGVDSSANDSIELSDFKVSLNEISLKWTVSTLKVLYYNSPTGTFKALLDRFNELDFIQDLEVKNYEKVWDNKFEFVLNAKVINDDK